MTNTSLSSPNKGKKNLNSSENLVSLPSILAYQRSFQTTDGHLYGVLDWDGTDPVAILPQERSYRGAIMSDQAILSPSNVHTEAKSSEKQRKAFMPNTIYGHHHAILPPDRHILEMRWNLQVIPGALAPAMSDESNRIYTIAEIYRKNSKNEKLTASEALQHLVFSLSEEERADLAARYLWRIIDGSVLWRNRIGHPCRTVIFYQENPPIVIQPSLFVLSSFPGLNVLCDWAGEHKNALISLHNHLTQALFSSESCLYLDIRTRVQMSPNHEVWPSQLLDPPADLTAKGDHPTDSAHERPPKRYFVVDINNAIEKRTSALTFQKIANRIRRIDEWHNTPNLGAICVEHYGYEMSAGVIYRKEKDNIYTILRRFLSGEVLSDHERMYAVAMLIRGGTFIQKRTSNNNKKNKKTSNATETENLEDHNETLEDHNETNEEIS